MSKGAETRQRVLDSALRLASRDGLGGVSLGSLAAGIGLSKSGLFAHFGSKEDLQVEVLAEAGARFEQQVLAAAFKAPRGEPRVRRLFELWLAWLDQPDMPGGCLFLAASAELDDHEGRPREFLVHAQEQLFATLARAARVAVEERHFRPDLDGEQFAFELFGIIAAYNHQKRLLRDARAKPHAQAAFEHLISGAAKPRRK